MELPTTSAELPLLLGTLSCPDVHLVRDLANHRIPNDYKGMGSQCTHEDPLTTHLFADIDVPPNLKFSLLGLLSS
ncbi:hypothetical protein HYDPIDRAFT_107883 [Hydnomerulius pinastri MD-312]|nr:hypothetical protein HYDPIDRAFT_107883 [Hydnomerulius pinastri MD-312]